MPEPGGHVRVVLSPLDLSESGEFLGTRAGPLPYDPVEASPLDVRDSLTAPVDPALALGCACVCPLLRRHHALKPFDVVSQELVGVRMVRSSVRQYSPEILPQRTRGRDDLRDALLPLCRDAGSPCGLRLGRLLHDLPKLSHVHRLPPPVA